MNFGHRVLVTGILQRKSEHRPNPSYREGVYSSSHTCTAEWKVWKPKPIAQRQGIVIGFRTLSNGVRDWIGEEEGYGFIPKEHFKAALVVFNERENPVYCLLGDVRLHTLDEQIADLRSGKK